MKNTYLKFSSVIPVAIFAISAGQSQFPADTILLARNTSIVQKIGVTPIALWQRISYSSNFLNCQFYPSCSNYGAQAIQSQGIIKGSFITSDRIIRCNPFAHYYHIDMAGDYHETDRRLVDPVLPLKFERSTKSPVAAAALSALLPGAGRAYAGRRYDGLMGFWIFSLSAIIAYDAWQKERPLKAPFFIGTTLIIYGGEIYGAYRSAKYYQPVSSGI